MANSQDTYEITVLINFRDMEREQEVYADVVTHGWTEDRYFFQVIIDEEFVITYPTDVIFSVQELYEVKEPRLKVVKNDDK